MPTDTSPARLAGATGRAIVARSWRMMRNGWPIVVRVKNIDGMVMAAVAQGYDGVLNLASGLDTRPYRLALPPPDLTWIEADFPAMIEEKARLLVGETPVARSAVKQGVKAEPAFGYPAFKEQDHEIFWRLSCRGVGG